MILGTWISNYKHMDKVVFVDREYKFKEGIIYFPDELNFSEDYTIYSDNLPYKISDILVLSNIQSNSFYLENPHTLYKALFERLDYKLTIATCEHAWSTKDGRTRCSLCKTRKY